MIAHWKHAGLCLESNMMDLDPIKTTALEVCALAWPTFSMRVLWVYAQLCKALVCFIDCIYGCFHENKDVEVFEELLHAYCVQSNEQTRACRRARSHMPQPSSGMHKKAMQKSIRIAYIYAVAQLAYLGDLQTMIREVCESKVFYRGPGSLPESKASLDDIQGWRVSQRL